MGKKKKMNGPKYGLFTKLLIGILCVLMTVAIIARVVHVFKNHF